MWEAEGNIEVSSLRIEFRANLFPVLGAVIETTLFAKRAGGMDALFNSGIVTSFDCSGVGVTNGQLSGLLEVGGIVMEPSLSRLNCEGWSGDDIPHNELAPNDVACDLPCGEKPLKSGNLGLGDSSAPPFGGENEDLERPLLPTIRFAGDGVL